MDLTLESANIQSHSNDSFIKSESKKTRIPVDSHNVNDCSRVLRQVFGHSGYKGKQKQIVEAAYGGADVLVVAPTGMGKSLCFQIPAVADKRGLSLVVSPLLALMQSQIENLRLKNIEVASLSSQVSPSEQQEICRQIQMYDTPIKLLYVTPERLCQPEFKQLLNVVHENHNLKRLVVDEAHCISEWGHDFREDYRRIGNFRDRYPDVPIMALTATATAAVQQDIIKSLKLDPKRLFTALHPFNRANLFYEIRYLSNPDPLNQMADIFNYITGLYTRRGRASSGIIYCRMRKTCDEMAAYLRGKGLNAKPYHRGIPSATLEKTMKAWTSGDGVDLVIATIAFGLGIDKGDVRYILHYDMPKSFEGYYQETGRGGRDGDPSKCILYYSREDAIRVKRFIRSSNPNQPRVTEDDVPSPTQRASGSLEALVEFAENVTTCRHVSICRYFGEVIDENDPEKVKSYCNRMCDVCRTPDKTKLRLSKLSSKEVASANVPFSSSNFVNKDTPPGRQQAFPSNDFKQKAAGQSGSRAAFVSGAQKRPSSEFSEGPPPKKLKSAPLLVTKPFGSASGLLKPFRPPSFVGKSSSTTTEVARPVPVYPPQLPIASISRHQSSKTLEGSSSSKGTLPKPVPHAQDLELEDEEVQVEDDDEFPVADLPKVGLVWEADHSSKVPMFERQGAFDSLRCSLHKLLIRDFNGEEAWSKIYPNGINGGKRNEIVFKTATELEVLGLSLSSTAEGYKNRISAFRADIQSLTDPSSWESNSEDDVQDIIASLRRCSSQSMNKGKGKIKMT